MVPTGEREGAGLNRTKVVARAATAVLGIALAAGAAACSSTVEEADSPAVVVPSNPGQTPSPTESPNGASPSESGPSVSIAPGTIPGTGRFAVGVDIQPGTYVSDTAPTVMCYAARLGKRDAPDPLITNHVVKGRTVVTIQATDSFFETRDCAQWRKR